MRIPPRTTKYVERRMPSRLDFATPPDVRERLYRVSNRADRRS